MNRKVAFTTNGTGAYAREVVVGLENVVRLPQLRGEVEYEDRIAASILLPGLTVGFLVGSHSVFKVTKKHCVLIHMADHDRFMSLLIAQLARARDARVIATVRSEEHVSFAQRICGENNVIVCGTNDKFTKRVKSIKRVGVDVVYCNASGVSDIEECVKCLKSGISLITYGKDAYCTIPVEADAKSISYQHFCINNLKWLSLHNSDFHAILQEVLSKGENLIRDVFVEVNEHVLEDAATVVDSFNKGCMIRLFFFFFLSIF